MVTKIKGDTDVSEDSAFRVGSFNINGKKLNVPLQALDAKKYYESKINFVGLNIGVAEIFRIYDKEKLSNFKIHPETFAEEDRKLKLWSDNIKDSTKFLFIRFEGRDYPNEEEMTSLINFSYNYSDATPIPVFPDIFKEERTRIKRNGQPITETKIIVTEDKLNKYLDFLNKYIEILNGLNHHDIIGSIPLVLGDNVLKLISFYYERNITHFYVDLNGAGFDRLMNSAFMAGILRQIKNIGLEYQKTFFYSINGSPGRFEKGKSVIGSKDIITSGAGLDSVGRMHLRAMGGKKITDPRVIEKNKLNRIRLFNKEDYGYYKLESRSLPFKLPEDNLINKDLILDLNKGKKFSDIFNMQQLVIENNNLRNFLKETPKPLPVISKNKANVSIKDIKSIQRFKEKINSLI